MGALLYHHSLDLLLIGLGLAAGVATLAGGALALRLQSRIHLILGFSAGAVIGVALLDLLPEALNLGGKGDTVLAFCALGFMAYLAIDRALTLGGAGAGRGRRSARALELWRLRRAKDRPAGTGERIQSGSRRDARQFGAKFRDRDPLDR